RIDKTRHHNATSGFDDFTITANQFFHFAPPADGFDVFTAHAERAIFEDCELPQIAARARMPRASEGHHLRAVYDCESFSHQSWRRLSLFIKRRAHQSSDDVFNQSPNQRNDHDFDRYNSQSGCDHVLVEVHAKPCEQRSDDRRLWPRAKSRMNSGIAKEHHKAKHKSDGHSDRDEAAAWLGKSTASKHLLHLVVQDEAVQHPLAQVQNDTGDDAAQN